MAVEKTTPISAARHIPLPADYQIEFNIIREVITSESGLPHRQFNGSAYWHGSFTPVAIGTGVEEEKKRKKILGFLGAADRESGWFLLDVAQPRISEAAGLPWHRVVEAKGASFRASNSSVHDNLKVGDVVSLINPAADMEFYPATRTIAEIKDADAGGKLVVLNHPLPGEMLFGTGAKNTGWELLINWERPVIRAVFQNPSLNWTSANGFMQLATQGWIEDLRTVVKGLHDGYEAHAKATGSTDTAYIEGATGARPQLESGDKLVGEGGG